MITAGDFLTTLSSKGVNFYTGVPCSFLSPLLNGAIRAADSTYLPATSEGEAVAIAAGAWLAGRNTMVMCQNSGLGNAINPLTSLSFPFRIPTLMIITWRGQPGVKDEPQHELMGNITHSMLDVIKVKHHMFPTRLEEVNATVDSALKVMCETELPFALVMPEGSVSDNSDAASSISYHRHGTQLDLCKAYDSRPSRYEIVQRLVSNAPEDAAIVATTGKSGRELFTVADREQHLYLVGSMGCASGVGLGLSLHTYRPVIVLDGDGAALMKLGTFATIGATSPHNLIHIVLDNGVYDSTGGQATAATAVDFSGIALACNYRLAVSCNTIVGFDTALSKALETTGPTLIHTRVRPGSIDGLQRPSVRPPEVARRFKKFITRG